MNEEKTALPFRLLDQGLDALGRTVNVAANLMLAVIGSDRIAGAAEEREGAPEGAAAPRATPEPVAQSTSRPGDTGTAASALATALDEKARRALDAATGEDGRVTDGLAIKDEGGRVPPDEELGPEPFDPQVGP